MPQIDRHLADLTAQVAAALEALDAKDPAPGSTPFGNYYVERVTFGFDGTTVNGVSVVPDEHGTYEIEVSA